MSFKVDLRFKFIFNFIFPNFEKQEMPLKNVN